MNRVPYPSLLTPPTDDNSLMAQYFNISFPMHAASPICEIDDLLGPYLEIIEQPAEQFRFRYKSEMTGTHGSIRGISSKGTNKPTFPTVALKNYDGASAIIRCSLYQHNVRDVDNMPHAHRLVRKMNNQEVDDPHEIVVTRRTKYTARFLGMAIISNLKEDIAEELVKKKIVLKREELARQGIFRNLNLKEQQKIIRSAEEEAKSINPHTVCLKFEAFIEGPNKVLMPICKPVFSHEINHSKSPFVGELKIVRMDHCSSPCKGGKEIFILVEKVQKKNIKIRFFEEDSEGNLLWEDYGKFSEMDVHHQYAIVFKTPPYRDINLKEKRKVYLDIVRPSDNAHSVPLEFTYAPTDSVPVGAKRAHVCISGFSSMVSSLASAELPDILDNIFTTDMMPNIDSDDFQRALKDLLPSYEGEQGSFAVDSPRISANGKMGAEILLDHKNHQKTQIEDEDKQYCIAVCKQLHGLIKTKPKKQKVVDMVNIYFDASKSKFPLHTAILLDNSFVNFLLKVIRVFEQKYILNMPNKYGVTPLHLAIQYDNFDAVKGLLECGASSSMVDENGNTALHMAVKSGSSNDILQMLMPVLLEYIDAENNDCDTPLNLALEFNNMEAIQYLIKNGANVNNTHKKDGYTPLRMAIEKQNISCICFMLKNCVNIDITKPDLRGINPVQFAKKLSSQSAVAQVIYRDLKKYMAEKCIQFEEPTTQEEESTDEELEFDVCHVQSESFTIQNLATAYENCKKITKPCLDKISAILDRSGAWKDLAKLLDLDYMIRVTNICDHNRNTMANRQSLFQIREFLEYLNEKEVITIMDAMVENC